MNPPDIFRLGLRSAMSLLPYLGVVAKPDQSRPEGISVFIRAGNAADWIESSILSIRDFADEIIVVENGSSDGTWPLIERLAKEIDIVRAYRAPQAGLLELTVAAEEKCRYRWTVRWDADFIAHTGGRSDIRGLREKLLALDRTRYYCVYLRPVNIFGDLEHVYGRGFLWTDSAYIHSSGAKYIFSGGVERLSLPKYYAVKSFDAPYFFHVNIKPKREMLFRHFWNDWLKLSPVHAGYPPEEYVARRIREDWGCGTLTEGEDAFIRRVICPNLVRYDAGKFGPYPALLEQLRRQPRYKVIYEAGKPVGREERVDRS